jgi:predicted phosphoribosyltransferase
METINQKDREIEERKKEEIERRKDEMKKENSKKNGATRIRRVIINRLFH